MYSWNIHAAVSVNAWNWINQKGFSAFGNRSLHSESHFQEFSVQQFPVKELQSFPCLPVRLSPYTVHDKEPELPLCLPQLQAMSFSKFRFRFQRQIFRGRYLIASFCLPPRDDSCQSLEDGVKFHQCCLLHGKFSDGNCSFLHCADTVVVAFHKGNVQSLISHGAPLQRGAGGCSSCLGVTSSFTMKQHFSSLACSLCKEEGEAGQVSCLRLCLLSGAELRSELKSSSPHASAALSVPKCGTDRKALMKTMLFKHFVRHAHSIIQL